MWSSVHTYGKGIPAAGLINYVPIDVPIYLIDPKPVHTGGYRNVKQILKGASEGMKELMTML